MNRLIEEAEALGIPTKIVMKGTTSSPEYLKAAKDLENAERMLSLPDDDPQIVNVLAMSGLSLEQYRSALDVSAKTARKIMDEQSADTEYPSPEFLDFVARRSAQAEQQLELSRISSGKTSSPKRAPTRNYRYAEKRPARRGAFAFLAVAAVIAAVVLSTESPSNSTKTVSPASVSSASSDSTTKNTFGAPATEETGLYVSTDGRSIFHKKTCEKAEKELGKKTYYYTIGQARSNGKTKCPVCFFETSTPASLSPTSPTLEEVDMPANGSMISNTTKAGDRIAPLEIKTSGDSAHFIKLESTSDPDKYITFFVRPGKTVEVDMPLGNYYLKYASGTTWYGTAALFGPDTIYTKSDDIFYFYEEDGYVNGYTVTLYLVNNGNMDTERINASEF